MRLIEILVPFVLFLSSAFGLTNHTSCNINVTPNEFDYSNLKLEHQITYHTLQDQVYLFDVLYKPHLDRTHHIEAGIGARQFFGNSGIGFNLFYAANSSSGVFGHQINYGLELFYSRLQFSLNHYHPIFPKEERRKEIILFHPISDFGITYKPSRKYEFGLYPFYDHFQDEWGAKGRVSTFISNAIELELSPSYRKSNTGITFSIGYHFPGPKSWKKQSIRKSRDFYYSSQEIKENNVIALLPPPLVYIPVEPPTKSDSVKEVKPAKIPKSQPLIDPILQDVMENIPLQKEASTLDEVIEIPQIEIEDKTELSPLIVLPARNRLNEFYMNNTLIADIRNRMPEITWKRAAIIAAGAVAAYYYYNNLPPPPPDGPTSPYLPLDFDGWESINNNSSQLISPPRPESPSLPYNDPDLAQWVSIGDTPRSSSQPSLWNYFFSNNNNSIPTSPYDDPDLEGWVNLENVPPPPSN
jgi:hypothetical protein